MYFIPNINIRLQNACITYGLKHALNVWFSIHALNVRYITYSLKSCFTYVKRTLTFLFILIRNTKKNGRDQTQSYDISPYIHRKILKGTWQHKNATKNFDYTTISDRLRTVSWSSDSHPTCVVKLVYGIKTFLLTAKAVKSKGHIFKNL